MAAADICLSLRAICSGDSLGSLRIIMCIWSLSVYPADEQRVLFAETFGCCRFVYNWALNLKITAYKERKEPKAEHEWLSEISSQSLQSALRNPDTAYTDFFRNTHAVGFPRFKSRKDRQSFLCPQHWRVDFSKSTITIPKAKDIPAVPRIKSDLNLDK